MGAIEEVIRLRENLGIKNVNFFLLYILSFYFSAPWFQYLFMLIVAIWLLMILWPLLLFLLSLFSTVIIIIRYYLF